MPWRGRFLKSPLAVTDPVFDRAGTDAPIQTRGAASSELTGEAPDRPYPAESPVRYAAWPPGTDDHLTRPAGGAGSAGSS